MSDVTMGPKEPIVSDHFVNREQQNETSHIGMWLFLAQEAMFFGGLFVAYAVYRYKFPEVWEQGSAQLDFRIGTFNTVVLLLSSVTMAMCVRSTMIGKWKEQIGYLCATMALGMAFLGIKYFEYKAKWDHGLVPSFNWDLEAQSHLEHAIDPVKGELFFSVLYHDGNARIPHGHRFCYWSRIPRPLLKEKIRSEHVSPHRVFWSVLALC